MRLAFAVVVVVLIIIFWSNHLNDYFSLAYLKNMHSSIVEVYQTCPVLAISVYMIAYIVITVFGLPVSIPLTLLGGSIFGFWVGTITISFASTIGATCAFLASRYLLRDWVQGAFGSRLTAINHGIEKDGLFYLFTLRLIPLFPFEAINYLMGLTPMPLRKFYWVSQIGMLPAAMIFVNAGLEFSRIESASGILSPTLLLSLTLIGIFPFAARKLLTLYRQRKTEAGPQGGEDGRI